MDNFNTYGGETKFEETIANEVGVDPRYVEVQSLKVGSVIVNYDIIADKNSGLSIDEIKKKHDEALKSGKLDLGGTLLSFKSGSDPEEITYVAPEEEPEKPKTNTLMAIGIIFAIAMVLLIGGIIYAKKMQASSIHDVYPQDKFEEEEELPLPKGKKDSVKVDIESFVPIHRDEHNSRLGISKPFNQESFHSQN